MLNEVFDKEAFEKSKQEIQRLCDNFDSHKDEYLNKNYKEARVRNEFIDPMFRALGWDVGNKKGKSILYQDVIVEDNITKGKKTTNPDYTFRIGGNRIFYVEAKAPHVNLEKDKRPAHQVRSYGWNAQLDICLLTDFHEFMVYETKDKPEEDQPASIGRVRKYKYTDYVDKWEEIYTLFSKEGVEKGFFDEFAGSNEASAKRGTSRVDSEFLKDIEKWRLLLARNIALRNKNLTLEELNLAVQLIIDRIVFFRMAEDRGIERYQTLYNLMKSENIYWQLCEVFKKADLKYNSGLFHFNDSPDYSEFVDNITLHLNIDDKVFKEIFKNLYYPHSPYQFSIISPEILGSIYENFLGSQIRLTKTHQARVELKPEVQKAGGVYYTPQYIADYIVENTVGKLIEGKTPNQISKMKILDPACGSGSFLLRAYQKLLDYHLDYYINLSKAPKDVFYVGKDNIPRLTIREKKRILTNNIFGVDIDVNAVEVTKLSLLLKVLEDENKDVLEQQQKLFQEKVLPNLSYNIKCGNSLVRTDILEQEDLEHEVLLKINPFDWKGEFPEIFENGGFDAVISNPPYVLIQPKEHPEYIINYYKDKFEVSQYKIDLYHLFFEKGINLLKNGGYFGFITPNPYLMNIYLTNLRKFILDSTKIKQIILTPEGVFKTAKVDTCIITLQKEHNLQYRKNNIIELVEFENKLKNLKTRFTKQEYFMNDEDFLFNINIDESNSFILRFLSDNFLKLKDIAHPYFGIQTYDKKKYVEYYKKDDSFKPCVNGKNIFKYSIQGDLEYVKFIEKAIKSGGKQEVYENEKIFVRQIGQSPIATYDKGGLYSLNTVYNIYSKSENFDLKFLLALFNSSFISFFWRIFFSDSKVLFPKIKRKYLEGIPIPNISLEDQRPFINLAEKMLELNNKLQDIKTPKEKKIVEQQIDFTDKKINKLVYELYGLNDEEIEIIENSLK